MTLPTNIAASSADAVSADAEVLGVHALMDRTATVLRLAAEGGDAHRVSRDQFNAARHLVDERVPSAQAICKRLKRSWAETVILALGPIAARMGQGQIRRDRQVDRDYPSAVIFAALKASAYSIGRLPSAQDYDAWAAAHAAGRERRGVTPNPLPHSTTIAKRFGDWADALVAAGIIESKDEAATGQPPRGSHPVIEIIDEFIDQVGILPTRRYFEQWCSRMDVPVGGDVRKWKQALAATRDRRSRAGKTTPGVITAAKDAPPLPAQVARTKRGTKAVVVWTKETILDALRYYGREYLKGAAPTQRHYGSCATGDPRLPAKSTLTARGKALGFGFQDWCREAGL
jgi:hypothetical protein